MDELQIFVNENLKWVRMSHTPSFTCRYNKTGMPKTRL